MHAGELTSGDALRLLGPDGADVVEELASRSAAYGTAYNLTVAEFHTYFVGAKGVLVHNASPCANAAVDLTEHRAGHILNGHRSGAGKPGKTEFPSSWSDTRILHEVSDVATDAAARTGVGKWKSPYATATRDGVEIRVDFYPSGHPKFAGKISTAYPTNTSPNPP